MWLDHVTNNSAEKNSSKDVNVSRMSTIQSVDNCPHTNFAASPHWCSLKNVLIFVDVTEMKVFVLSATSPKADEMVFDQQVSFAIPTSDSQEDLLLFVGLETKIIQVNFDKKQILREVVQLPMEFRQTGRIVTAKCSPHGTLYVNCVNKPKGGPPRGHMLRLSVGSGGANCKLHKLYHADWSEVIFQVPNGTAWVSRHPSAILLRCSHFLLLSLLLSIFSSLLCSLTKTMYWLLTLAPIPLPSIESRASQHLPAPSASSATISLLTNWRQYFH